MGQQLRVKQWPSREGMPADSSAGSWALRRRHLGAAAFLHFRSIDGVSVLTSWSSGQGTPSPGRKMRAGFERLQPLLHIASDRAERGIRYPPRVPPAPTGVSCGGNTARHSPEEKNAKGNLNPPGSAALLRRDTTAQSAFLQASQGTLAARRA